MEDLEVAIAAAEAGAAVVRERFGTVMGRVEKATLDFATDADPQSQRAMIAVLRAERPEDTVLGRSRAARGPGTSLRVWLIDPLCMRERESAWTSCR